MYNSIKFCNESGSNPFFFIRAGAKGTPKKAAPKAAAATEDSPPKAAPKAAVKGTAVAPTAATKKTGIPKPGTIVNNTNAPAAAKPAVEDNSTTPSINQEEVVAKAGALISMDIINQLAEKKVWKQRLDGKYKKKSFMAPFKFDSDNCEI